MAKIEKILKKFLNFFENFFKFFNILYGYKKLCPNKKDPIFAFLKGELAFKKF